MPSLGPNQALIGKPGSRALLDSFTSTEEVYGRLRRLARELKEPLPCVGSLTSLAAEGNGEALSRLVELARASTGDASAQRTISVALADVAAHEEGVQHTYDNIKATRLSGRL